MTDLPKPWHIQECLGDTSPAESSTQQPGLDVLRLHDPLSVPDITRPAQLGAACLESLNHNSEPLDILRPGHEFTDGPEGAKRVPMHHHDVVASTSPVEARAGGPPEVPPPGDLPTPAEFPEDEPVTAMPQSEREERVAVLERYAISSEPLPVGGGQACFMRPIPTDVLERQGLACTDAWVQVNPPSPERPYSVSVHTIGRAADQPPISTGLHKAAPIAHETRQVMFTSGLDESGNSHIRIQTDGWRVSPVTDATAPGRLANDQPAAPLNLREVRAITDAVQEVTNRETLATPVEAMPMADASDLMRNAWIFAARGRVQGLESERTVFANEIPRSILHNHGVDYEVHVESESPPTAGNTQGMTIRCIAAREDFTEAQRSLDAPWEIAARSESRVLTFSVITTREGTRWSISADANTILTFFDGAKRIVPARPFDREEAMNILRALKQANGGGSPAAA